MAIGTQRQPISTGSDYEQNQGQRSSGLSSRSRNGSTLSLNTNGNQQSSAERLARGLGWFSIGLGAAEVLAPRFVAKISGVQGNKGLIRLFGVREICSGLAIFAQGRQPAAAVWSRVAGDALDLAALGTAFTSPTSKKGRVAFATANVLAVTALDVMCAQQLSNGNAGSTRNEVKTSVIINRSPQELYEFWRNFENLPLFMHQLESVRHIGEGRTRWTAKGPGGVNVEWDAQLTEDKPDQLIAWQSVEGSDVQTSGVVTFERTPGNRGTMVEVRMTFDPPGGVIGATIAKLTGDDPEAQAKEALRSFKQLVETGEVVVSDGSFWDNGLLTQRPAQPVSEAEAGTSRRTA